jgi:hypothetical protein
VGGRGREGERGGEEGGGGTSFHAALEMRQQQRLGENVGQLVFVESRA